MLHEIDEDSNMAPSDFTPQCSSVYITAPNSPTTSEPVVESNRTTSLSTIECPTPPSSLAEIEGPERLNKNAVDIETEGRLSTGLTNIDEMPHGKRRGRNNNTRANKPKEKAAAQALLLLHSLQVDDSGLKLSWADEVIEESQKTTTTGEFQSQFLATPTNDNKITRARNRRKEPRSQKAWAKKPILAAAAALYVPDALAKDSFPEIKTSSPVSYLPIPPAMPEDDRVLGHTQIVAWLESIPSDANPYNKKEQNDDGKLDEDANLKNTAMLNNVEKFEGMKKKRGKIENMHL